jgi:hypothetical protein
MTAKPLLKLSPGVNGTCRKQIFFYVTKRYMRFVIVRGGGGGVFFSVGLAFVCAPQNSLY